MDIKQWVKKDLLEMDYYPAVAPKERILLGTNESPYNITDDAFFRDGFARIVGELSFNRYPDPEAIALRDALAEYTQTRRENILVGNGADEMIDLVLAAFIDPGDAVIIHSPSFEMYEISANLKGARIVPVADVGHRIDADGLIAAANRERAKLLFLCLPNNPTGYTMPPAEVQKIIDGTDCMVVLDMAYLEFSAEKYDALLLNPRVIRLRTLSKAFGLAGLRVGYALADPAVIRAINYVRPPFNLNVVSQSLALFVLQNRSRLTAWVEQILSEKKRVYEALSRMEHVEVVISSTNFLLIRIDGTQCVLFEQLLREQSVKIRIYPDGSRLRCHYRLSIGKPEENDVVLAALQQLADGGEKDAYK